jgi:23S rRNA pseudouridine1911/1915/1917 synthase
MDAQFQSTVSSAHSGLTFYQYLDAYFPFQENKRWSERVVTAHCSIDGVLITGNPILTAGQELSFVIADYEEDTVDTRWSLLWQDDELLAVHKPGNLPVHRTTRNVFNTLTALVRRESDWPEAQLLHRLDQETAGIILFVKNKQSALFWQPNFAQLLKEKIYHAVVYGEPTWQVHTSTTRLSTVKDSSIRCQMHVDPIDGSGKRSITHFKCIERKGAYSIIECKLETGRKHQIRAHLAHLGHPIVGDKIYAHRGQYYLRRLQDQLTEQDEQMILTSHHLLVAQRVTLNRSLRGLPEVTITDTQYPSEWVSFLASSLIYNEPLNLI